MSNPLVIASVTCNMILTAALLYFIIRHAKEWRKVKREIRIVRKAVIRIMLKLKFHPTDVIETLDLEKWYYANWNENHDVNYNHDKKIDELFKYAFNVREKGGKISVDKLDKSPKV